MHSAQQAYTRTANTTLSPRELEAHLLLRAAAKFQVIKDDWATLSGDINEALLYNRKLWTVFVTSVTDKESQLPDSIRENIANLGIFIFKRTVELEGNPVPEKLSALIDINRNVAAGLRGQAPTNVK